MTRPSLAISRLCAVLACAAAGCDPGRVGEPRVSGPPVATIEAPVEGTIEVAPGTSLAFAGSCSVAAATHAWSFGGAAPAESTAVAPGPVRFDAEGSYAVSYRCAAAEVVSAAVQRTVVVRQPRASAYQLEVRYLTPASASQQAAFEAAAARVREVIVGAVPTAHASGIPCGGVSISEDVPGLLILVDLSPIDGVGKILGQAGPCATRAASGLPLLGQMTFDSADVASLDQSGRLQSVVLHEMLHVIGFGTIWEDDGLLRGKGGSDPRFLGPAAAGAFQDWNGGLTATVPVENTGSTGTRDAHWRERGFGDELMTGWISGSAQPLSRTTVGSLADLGYEVEPLRADPFQSTAAALREGPGEDELELVEDVRLAPPIVVP